MNTLTALLLFVLACSSFHVSSAVQRFEYPENSFNRLFNELDTPDDFHFNLLFNEEFIQDLFNQEDIFASDAFDAFAEAAFDLEEGETSLDDLIFSNEEVLGFFDLINNKKYNTDRLFEDNGFFQASSGPVNNEFNEELASALLKVKDGEEKLNIMLSALVLNVINNMENGEAETAFPLTFASASAAAADGFDGIEGEEEKGEENLEARSNVLFINEIKTNPSQNSSMNLYLAIGCVSIAVLVVGAVIIGVRNLRKHEETVEEDNGSNYLQLRN